MRPIGTPAFRALLDACRCWLEFGPSPGDPAEVNWRQAGRLSFFHNLDPLLYRLAEGQRLPGPRIPDDVLATWESNHYLNFLFNTRALEILEQLADAAREASIALVAFKGPATLARAYGDPALRVMVDLDLVLRRRDLDALSRLASRMGFTPTGQNHLIHSVVRQPESGFDLELHFDVYDFLLRRRELVEHVLADRVELELDGRSFPAASPELALVLEVAHLVNHDFRVNLRNWLDLAALLSKGLQTVDWQALEAALRTHGVLPEFLLAVEVSAELFGLPPATVPFYCPSGYSERARRSVIERVATADRGFDRPALQELAYRSGVGAKVSYVCHRLFPTGERLRALTAGGRIVPALAKLYSESIDVAARELRRWRSSGVAADTNSIKAAVYARNRRSDR